MEQSLAERTAMIGADVEVPCLDGRTRRYVDLDHAASTPAMAGVWAAPLFARPAAELLYVPLGWLAALSVVILALRRQSGRYAMAESDVHPGREQQVRQP